MPKRPASSSRPTARVKSPLPSASISTSSPTPWSSPQAFITNTSFTDTQAMVSTPLAFSSAACALKPGRCLAEQVGVKAPGTANSATFFPANSSSLEIGFGPSAPKVVNVALGTLSPALMDMSCFPGLISPVQIAGADRIAKRRALESTAVIADHRAMPGLSGDYLTGRLLVAMPGIDDPRFERAVVFVCAHDSDHAMGLTINRPVEGLTVSRLLARLKVKTPVKPLEDLVLMGGPVEQERGFVLHTDDYGAQPNSVTVGPGIVLTATREVLEAMSSGEPHPRRAVMALGYAGWG